MSFKKAVSLGLGLCPGYTVLGPPRDHYDKNMTDLCQNHMAYSGRQGLLTNATFLNGHPISITLTRKYLVKG